MFLKSIAGIMTACAVSFASAQAAFITSTSSATFVFDVSGLGDTTFSNFVWCGANTGACVFNPGPDDDDHLAGGATMQLDFGTSPGASDIGISTFTNPFPNPTNNAGATLIPTQSILASLNTLYVTFVFVDDNYGAVDFSLRFLDQNQQFQTIDGVEIPLPAAFPLFLVGVAGLGFARRRRKNA